MSRLYVGFPAFVLREVPFDAIQMTAFECLKRFHAKAVQRTSNAQESALLGAVAGVATGLVTTPLDAARTAEVCARNAGIMCKGPSCIIQLAEKGGPRIFFRGAIPRMIEIGIGGALYFSVIEGVGRFLDSNERDDAVDKRDPASKD